MTQGAIQFGPADAGESRRDAFAGIPCARPGCGSPVEPQSRGGSARRYCSRACQRTAWDDSHGRARVKPVPPTGEPYQKARVWLLKRLETGPVCTLELRREPWPASLNPAQRVLELRNKQYDIRTVRAKRRTWYWLWEDGEPVGKVEE